MGSRQTRRGDQPVFVFVWGSGQQDGSGGNDAYFQEIALQEREWENDSSFSKQEISSEQWEHDDAVIEYERSKLDAFEAEGSVMGVDASLIDLAVEASLAEVGRTAATLSGRRTTKSTGLELGMVGTYKELNSLRRSRGSSGQLHLDHVPSKASALQAARNAKGSELTPAERRAVINNGPAVAEPADVHKEYSRTFGGRNSKEKIMQDAADQSGAVRRDLESYNDALGAGVVANILDDLMMRFGGRW